MLQNGPTFCHQKLPQRWTSVNAPQLLAMGAWEKDQEDYMRVINILPLLRDEPLAWIAKDWEFCCLPVWISSAPQSCI